MTNSATSRLHPNATPLDRPDRWSSRLLRSLVLRHLERVHGGELLVRDTHGEQRFGEMASTDDHALRAAVTVTHPRFYRRVAMHGSLGVADSYIRGEWEVDDLTSMLRIFIRDMATADSFDRGGARLTAPLKRLGHWLRRNTKLGSRKNIQAHYDLGNDFFRLFLDETMTYSCGIFLREDASMEDASIAKLDRLCRKLDLQPTDHLLEIGTGWGSMAMHAAQHYGCRVTTTTISKEQRNLAMERIREAGLDDRIEVLLVDYRDLEGRYDKLVSIEMIEAVGHEFLGTYFATCSSLLKTNGLMALQAITMPSQRYEQYRQSVDFIRKYVFPGSHVPSMKAMLDAMTRSSDLQPIDLEDIGPHYATTLRRWRSKFHERIEDVRALGYPEEFIRMWDYYLCYCEAGFAERYIGDLQLVLSRTGAPWTTLHPRVDVAARAPAQSD